MIDTILSPNSPSHNFEHFLNLKLFCIYSEEFENLTLESVISETNTVVYEESTRMEPGVGSCMMESPLLTHAGEKYLFLKMNFLKHHTNQLCLRLNPKRPSRAQIQTVKATLARIEQTRTAIVEANTRLVASIAHKFANSRTEYEDLISEGNLILVNAVDKFDYSRGFRFSTYATHAIQRHYYRYLQRKQKRNTRECTTPTEILSDVTASSEQVIPLDYKVAEALIARFDECLDDREAVIIRERFGLNDSHSSETLKVVADRVGLSKERVRQLQMRAIEKLQDLAIQMKLRLDPSFLS